MIPRVALTSGEPAGIGPELCLALARDPLPCELVCLADRALLSERARSRARIVADSCSESAVMASLTALSGRWVVASATRSSPAVSSITTRALRVRCARNSVWPLERTPASLITLLCTGAVTMASNSPLSAPATARSSSAST